MPTLRVVQPGMFTTVQDLGRFGFAASGVAPAGAADTLSLRIGNRIAGNRDDAAALEMTLVGGVFTADDHALIVISGASPRAATIKNAQGVVRAIPSYNVVDLNAGEELQIGPLDTGARTYMCVRGGIDVQPVLGARATHVASGIGGFNGRALRAGDELSIGNPPPAMRREADDAGDFARRHIFRNVLRVTPGPHAPSFDGDAVSILAHATYEVSEKSDRMGVRLAGPSVPTRTEGRMITEPMPAGAIQIPEGGQPLILGPDRPTTGGYPVIVNIIAADLSAVGQSRPRDQIRFEFVTIEAARTIWTTQRAELDRLIPPAEGRM